MRNMSFAFTSEQIIKQVKWVTRRNAWWFLRVGDLVQPVRKGMGLKKGEKIERLGCPLLIVATRREMLCKITRKEVVLEGFPDMKKQEFIEMYCRHNKVLDDHIINRIEFEYTLELQA